MKRSPGFRSSIVGALLCGWLVVLAGTPAPAQDVSTAALSAGPAARFAFPTNLSALPGKGVISMWKGFPALWAQRRAEFWRDRDQDKGAVVFLGDSITQGWNDMAKDFPNLRVANRGIGGDVTRGVLYRLKEDVLDLDPAAVVLLIGINDLGNGGEPGDTADNIKSILDRLEQSNPRMPIVVCKVMPSKQALAPKIEKLNARIDEMIRGDRHVIPCDTWSLFVSGDGTCYHGIFPDMLHPNKVGYEEWAAKLRPIFAGLDLPQKQAP